MSIQHFFSTQPVEMTDDGKLFEIITPGGEHVASATIEAKLKTLEIALNIALTEAAEADSDIVINCA
jgi:hypothetical protein